MHAIRHLFSALLGACALTSCAQPPVAAPAEPESQRLARELRALIGPAACTTHSQCRSLPVGAKACGGPAAYWAWSTLDGDAGRIAALAARQAEAHRREIEAAGVRSNCLAVVDPGAACQAGRCEPANPADAAGR